MNSELRPGDERLIHTARAYFARLSAQPLPSSLASGAPPTLLRARSRGRRVATSIVAFAVVAVIVAVVILGVGRLLATRQQTTVTAPPPTASAAPPATPPPGGLPPATLNGDWQVITTADNNRSDLIVTGGAYHLQTSGGDAYGEVVVNGAEMDFFNGVACGIALPGGVGRYQWSLSVGILQLTPLSIDPCSGREQAIGNHSFRRVGG
jgi:hypothetical protein